MTIIKTKYRTADLDPWVLEQFVEDYSSGDSYGYVLIDDHLVPYAFIERIDDYVNEFTLNGDYEDVLPVKEILSGGFWESLDEDQRRVAGACLLMVIENGYVPVLPKNRHQFKVESTL